MTNASLARWRWIRFSLSHLFVLTLGVALGFAPLKLWELGAQGEPRIHVHMLAVEVPRDQLASLGIPPGWQAAVGIPPSDLDGSLSKQLAAMRETRQARVLAEPTLVTVSGRVSSFNIGGEVPVPVTADDGIRSVKYQEFGTRIDLVPTLLRNGRIRVELSSEIRAADHGQAAVIDADTIPSFRRTRVESEIDLADGETVLLCADCAANSGGDGKKSLLIMATVEKAKSR